MNFFFGEVFQKTSGDDTVSRLDLSFRDPKVRLDICHLDLLPHARATYEIGGHLYEGLFSREITKFETLSHAGSSCSHRRRLLSTCLQQASYIDLKFSSC